ncbi:hypothetical protein WJX73_000113 [Symbiochloris irregularis]|uniref:Uncharacterized protein n=1 Tax=Symbiochloris irregularis TaxID=706552 RepID=A0AAW1PU03_9CHLO
MVAWAKRLMTRCCARELLQQEAHLPALMSSLQLVRPILELIMVLLHLLLAPVAHSFQWEPSKVPWVVLD